MSVRTPTLPFESRSVRLGLLAGDAGSSRLVYAMVFALIVIGIVLIVLAVVVFRRTRVDPSVLAPLERMGSRKWRKSDEQSRRELLDAVRPAGAIGPSPSEPGDTAVDLPPPVIEPTGESPHDATFVAGPDGVEPVETSASTEAEPAPERSADEAAPAEVVPAEVVAAGEPAGSDVDVAASDDAGLPDPVVPSDDVVLSDDVVASEDAVAAPDAAIDDGASADDSVGSPVEPVDDSVAGK